MIPLPTAPDDALDPDRRAAVVALGRPAAHAARHPLVDCPCGGEIADQGPDGGTCLRCGRWDAAPPATADRALLAARDLPAARLGRGRP